MNRCLLCLCGLYANVTRHLFVPINLYLNYLAIFLPSKSTSLLEIIPSLTYTIFPHHVNFSLYGKIVPFYVELKI